MNSFVFGFKAMFGLIAIAALIYIYLFPAALARHRKHPHVVAITILNVLLGWTVIAWVALAVWSCFYRSPSAPLPSVTINPRHRQPRVVLDAFSRPHVQGEVFNPPSFVYLPRTHRPTDKHPDYFWLHPKGYPFQVQGGDHETQVWTDSPKLDGYTLVSDEYSDRLYHVPTRGTEDE